MSRSFQGRRDAGGPRAERNTRNERSEAEARRAAGAAGCHKACHDPVLVDSFTVDYYHGSMKVKTSITLSQDILKALAKHAGSGASRSAYIERVLRAHFRRKARAAAQARDVERINAAAARLNAEAEDVLTFQAPWSDDD